MYDKTGVINDPLCQPLVPAGSNCHLILKFWDDVQMLCVITTGWDCGQPRGSTSFKFLDEASFSTL